MPMQKTIPAAHPDAYIASLSGWQQRYAAALRTAVGESGVLREVIKWGHLVYFMNGPVLLIRAEANRVLFGFWRGQRLQAIEPRLKSGGKYEMATLALTEHTPLERSTVLALVREAIILNAVLGDPTNLDFPRHMNGHAYHGEADAVKHHAQPSRQELNACPNPLSVRCPPRPTPSVCCPICWWRWSPTAARSASCIRLPSRTRPRSGPPRWPPRRAASAWCSAPGTRASWPRP
ncbi:DUF1801 domain-containing protein [Massilia sp. B-10]|nr:DUF1801 domain-containing protein [Massilia sp. B-10]